MRCYKCNSFLGYKDNYCSNCGAKIFDESILNIDIKKVLKEAEEHLLNLSTEELAKEIINLMRDKKTSPNLFLQNYLAKISIPILAKVNPLISADYFTARLDYEYDPRHAIKYKISVSFIFIEIRGLIYRELLDFQQEWTEEYDPDNNGRGISPWGLSYFATSIFYKFNTLEDWPKEIDYDLISIQLKCTSLWESFEVYVQKEVLGITDEYWNNCSGKLDKWNEIFYLIFDNRTLDNLYLYLSKINGREIDVDLFNKVISELFDKKELYFEEKYDHNIIKHLLKRI